MHLLETGHAPPMHSDSSPRCKAVQNVTLLCPSCRLLGIVLVSGCISAHAQLSQVCACLPHASNRSPYMSSINMQTAHGPPSCVPESDQESFSDQACPCACVGLHVARFNSTRLRPCALHSDTVRLKGLRCIRLWGALHLCFACVTGITLIPMFRYADSGCGW